MVEEDVMDVCQEPQSSQPYGLYEWPGQTVPHRAVDDDNPLVNWIPPRSELSAIVQDHLPPPPQEAASNSLALSTKSSAANVSISRRPGNVNHPAHKPRHTVFLPETQDPEVREAVQLFNGKAFQTVNYSLELSKRKAAKRNPSLKENRSSHSSGTLQRRRTVEDVTAIRPQTIPKSHSIDSHAPAISPSLSTASDSARPIAGPSKVIFRRPSLTSFVNSAPDDDDDEEMDFPSSTPTPPPKHHIPQRATSSTAGSNGKSRNQSAFAESPTSLPQGPLARRHSEDPSASYGNTRPGPLTPANSQHSMPEQPSSPIIPSPVTLGRLSGYAMPPPPAPIPPRPAPSSFISSQSQRTHSQAPANQRHPPPISQSPALSRPYVMPSLSQSAPGSASQPAEPPRPSQRRPPALGMRPTIRAGGVSKYQVPREPPRVIAGFKVPFKKPVTTAESRQGNAAEDELVCTNPTRTATSTSTNGGFDTRAIQRSASPIIPDPPYIAARAVGFTSGSRAHNPVQIAPPTLEMSARRAEPRDPMEEGQEADSSYGDIPFDFDPEALDEAMSMYDA
ncbi:hypothetical protein C2E23DRAFT_857701 [Lenzites betulinus]|nr:hypothetical protein C2E23DRAFT_857701 [Lenzites betulinus]